jgi:hypothetical protein
VLDLCKVEVQQAVCLHVIMGSIRGLLLSQLIPLWLAPQQLVPSKVAWCQNQGTICILSQFLLQLLFVQRSVDFALVSNDMHTSLLSGAGRHKVAKDS